MYGIARLSDDELKELFQNTATEKVMNPAVVEKDFWVCLALDYLFHDSKWSKGLAFKGGTCLAKAYSLIKRFSEDIDLILDWRILGYGINEPWEERSNTKQQIFIEDSRKRLYSFLSKNFVPEIRRGLELIVGKQVEVEIDEFDEGIVNFVYPSLYQDPSILKVIRLELGALSAWTPTQKAEITPYAAEAYPKLFEKRSTNVLTTTPERSFWEKATILHHEAFRPEYSTIPARYSRHYYDLYCMSKTSVKDNAIAQPELLNEVARFKNKFYPRGWARYDLAKVGTLHLTVAKHNEQILHQDYVRMRSMIFGEYPSYEEVMDGITKLEKEINQFVA